MEDNFQLTDLGNFPVLQSIGRSFYVMYNSKLTDLGYFPVLQSIGENFEVRDNFQLSTLGNFPALTSIGRGEAYVPSLSADRNKVSILVENNLNLSDCSVLRKFLSGGSHAVSGQIYINNNATGCEMTE